MEKRIKYNNGGINSGKFSDYFPELSGDDFVLSPEDQVLLEKMGTSISVMLDLEEIKNDPGYENVRAMAPEIILEYKNKPFWNRENVKFVIESIEEAEEEAFLSQEIREIKRDALVHGVDAKAAEWVAGWSERKNNGLISDNEKNRREYISGALADELQENEEKYSVKPVIINSKNRSFKLIKYFSLPAAAALLTFMILKFFTPQESPDELFNKYYQPAFVVSAVTRGIENDFAVNYSAGIEKYRKGDYTGALYHFGLAMKADEKATGTKFYYGITSLALGDFRSAEEYLDELAGTELDFGKDAQWYLGLAYLRTDEREKAIQCFKQLASSPGYYRDKALKILRRLK